MRMLDMSVGTAAAVGNVDGLVLIKPKKQDG
jgi:hypothetical protein